LIASLSENQFSSGTYNFSSFEQVESRQDILSRFSIATLFPGFLVDLIPALRSMVE
jgi:hypothetical protein